jgi:DNA-binding NarL/FixJ family response regulator
MRQACAASGRATLVTGYLDSIGALESAVAQHEVDLALIPGAWLRDAGLGLLVRLGAARPEIKVVLVGGDLSATAVAQALPLGLRGILAAAISTADLAKAIAAILGGELWLSRRKMLEVVNAVSYSERSAHSDTWRNLPALTEREHAVLQEVLTGRSNKEIAKELDISEQTVKIHLQHIYRKLGVHRRLDLLLASK